MAQRVLVVEQDVDLRSVMAELLNEAGFDVDRTADWSAARKAMTVHDHALVLIDWPGRNLPSDWSEVESMAREAAPAALGVISVLADVDRFAPRHQAAFGLRKPFTLEDLIHAVSQTSPIELAPADAARVRDYFAALTAADWDWLARLCSDEVEYCMPGDSPLARTVRGRQAFREFSAETFSRFPDCRFVLDEVLPLPGGAIGRYHATWRGRSEPVTGAVLFKLEQGQIAQIGVRTDVSRLVG